MGCLMVFAFSPWRVWRSFWKCRGVTKRTLMSEEICECARMNSSSGGTGIERMTTACGNGNVPMVKRVRSRKRDDRAVREPVWEEHEVGAQLVPLDLGKVGLNVPVEHDELGARDLVCIHQ